MSLTSSDEREAVLETARRGREAAVVLRTLTRAQKDVALLAIADALDAATDRVVAANAGDVERAVENGTDAAIVDRLTFGGTILETGTDSYRLAQATKQRTS